MTPSELTALADELENLCPFVDGDYVALMKAAGALRSLAAQQGEPDKLHAAIMNLPCDGATLDWANTREAYLYGHRAARHAAAELALALHVPSQTALPNVNEGSAEEALREALMRLQEERDGYRTALEVIAVGDAGPDPVKAAQDHLVSVGHWRAEAVTALSTSPQEQPNKE